MSELSCTRLFATPWTVAHQIPVSMESSREEYWSGLPFPSPGIFPTQGLNPCLLKRSPALAGRFFITSTTWEADVPNICEVYLIPESINNKNYSSKQFYYTDYTYAEIIIFQAQYRAAPAQGARQISFMSLQMLCLTRNIVYPVRQSPKTKSTLGLISLKINYVAPVNQIFLSLPCSLKLFIL